MNISNWVILEVTFKGQKYYKVLCQVGYGQHDWRINSGITKVHETPSNYIFEGASGSTYECPKSSQGMSSIIENIFWQVSAVSKVVLAKNIQKQFLLTGN